MDELLGMSSLEPGLETGSTFSSTCMGSVGVRVDFRKVCDLSSFRVRPLFSKEAP